MNSVGALAPPQRKARRFGLAREDGDGAGAGGEKKARNAAPPAAGASGFALKREDGCVPPFTDDVFNRIV